MQQKEKVLDIKRRLDRPIVLVGLMGVGKTRLARALAETLDLPLQDSDTEIEKAAQMSVKDIFETFGESHFRDGERRVIRRLIDGSPRIISTGGGAIVTPETAEIIFSETLSIWIKADIDVMVSRTEGSDKRPLLNEGDHRKILTDLMDERYPIYERADITIESSHDAVGKHLHAMLDKLDSYLLQNAS